MINIKQQGINKERCEGSVPVTNVQVAITKMLESIKNKKRRLSYV